MKHTKKLLAVLLAAVITFSFSVQPFAASAAAEGKPYSPFARIFDSVCGAAQDAVFRVVQNLTRQKNIPSYEEYLSQAHPQFYTGTNGRVIGSGWSAGFACGSVIPESWRCDANGKSDPNGWCLKTIHPTGGYQTFVSKLYTDQMLNMIILSNGTDGNRNGVDDVLIFISVDGVGITAGTCLKMRAAVEQALAAKGVTSKDILACSVSATHCHAGLDIQGMSIPLLFANKLNPFTDYDRSMNQTMENTICEQAGACASAAFGKIEPGQLSFFETTKVNGTHDKLNSGANIKNTFSCFLFEGESGEKTVMTNIGSHPTSYGAWNNNRMMSTDYPYYMAMALKDAGYHLVFTQSAEASVSSPGISYEAGDAKDRAASAWVQNYALTKEDWAARYGQKYADKQYDNLEEDFEHAMKNGYLLAHHILDASANAVPVAPVLNIQNKQTLLTLDNGVMALGSISGLLGENVVRIPDSESGYGVMVETNYMEIGNDVVILTAPGELSPTLVYGTDPDYTGTALWTGTTSWAGTDWQYDTLEGIVRTITGDSDKTVLLYGITNDALGYMFPDICTPTSLLGTALFYKENPSDMTNCMLMTVGVHCGSQLVESYTDLIKNANN